MAWSGLTRWHPVSASPREVTYSKEGERNSNHFGSQLPWPQSDSEETSCLMAVLPPCFLEGRSNMTCMDQVCLLVTPPRPVPSSTSTRPGRPHPASSKNVTPSEKITLEGVVLAHLASCSMEYREASEHTFADREKDPPLPQFEHVTPQPAKQLYL